eukprot:COSAG05_NODE_20047_length_284_cov_0.275676_1_plen_85_part_10
MPLCVDLGGRRIIKKLSRGVISSCESETPRCRNNENMMDNAEIAIVFLSLVSIDGPFFSFVMGTQAYFFRQKTAYGILRSDWSSD